jgi:hypothetical protein
MITKAERTELRSLVRGQFKVLRSEVAQRRAEMISDLSVQLAERYAGWDKQWSDATFLCQEAVLEANRKVNDILREMVDQPDGGRSEWLLVSFHAPAKPDRQRTELYRAGLARIDADVRAALLRLDREEADLLRTLAIGALESDEAHAFLNAIPTVGELVSAARLAELEADLGDAP